MVAQCTLVLLCMFLNSGIFSSTIDLNLNLYYMQISRSSLPQTFCKGFAFQGIFFSCRDQTPDCLQHIFAFHGISPTKFRLLSPHQIYLSSEIRSTLCVGQEEMYGVSILGGNGRNIFLLATSKLHINGQTIKQGRSHFFLFFV